MSQAVKRTTVKKLSVAVEHPKTKTSQCALNTLKPTHGFSLVELLVVVAILAVLAAIAIPLFLNQRSKAVQGAVQSDSRNLATNLNTLFANLPRSADPNVALNGSTAPNATLSGSGTISVGGETLNVNLSPDVTITKTGNADPTVGAGLKITHAGVENWACVIPLPPSVAYAQTMTFQQTCGAIVSEEGNLLTMNQASVETSNPYSGYAGGNSVLGWATNMGSDGVASVIMDALNEAGTTSFYGPATPVIPGSTYTVTSTFRTVSGTKTACVILSWYDSSNAWLGDQNPKGCVEATSTGWATAATTGVAPAGAAKAYLRPLVYSLSIGESVYIDEFGTWEGLSGVWNPPGSILVQP